MAGRKGEIENILLKAQAKGLSALFLTVTLQHTRDSELSELLKTLLAAWRSVFSGDRTGERQVLSRVKAQIKSVETRWGRNGFHPHLHVLLMVDEAGLSETEAGLFEDKLAEVIFSRYQRAVEKRGMVAEREAYNSRPVSMAGAAAHYVTKIEAALELTSPDTKKGFAGGARSYTMFQLLSLYERGERQLYGKDIAEVFREFARATKGKRAVSYSRGIKDLLGIEAKPDEELALEAELPEEKTIAVVSADVWRVVCARKMRAQLLAVADSGDERQVSAWLDALGVKPIFEDALRRKV